jgi:U1 small nuclear ribonucleoprotein 70kDa
LELLCIRMTAFLPPNLLALFAAREPVPFLPPITRPPHFRKLPYTGIAQFLTEFEDPSETPAPTKAETKEERKERKRREKQEHIDYKLEQDLAIWDPNNDPNISSDPYKTLFVARVNYDTSENKLMREFEIFGPIKQIHVVKNSVSGKPRGYAFIEYAHERDMHAAYKNADGRKIDGRRVLVDVERARTVRGWRPRRLGGGLGTTRRGAPEINSRYSGRDDRDRSRSRERKTASSPRGFRSSEKGRERDRERDRDRDRDRTFDRSRRDEKRSRPSRSRSKERRHKRSRSPDRERDRDRQRDRNRRRSGSREKDRKSRREDRNGGVSASVRQYGEYGAEIAEFGDS